MGGVGKLEPGDTGAYELEGLGHSFIPTVMDTSVIDRWVKTTDKESFIMARRLIKDEALLVG